MAIYPIEYSSKDEGKAIPPPFRRVDEHVYRKMEEILARVKRIETTVSHLVDRQIIYGVTIDRLFHTDGADVDGPVLDPED